MSDKHILRSYRMTHITGFAPNVNGSVLTLATCLGGLRRHWKCGEWIGGFVGKKLAKELQNPSVEKNLVYLAKVSKTLDLESYWSDYPQKRLDIDEWVIISMSQMVKVVIPLLIVKTKRKKMRNGTTKIFKQIECLCVRNFIILAKIIH